ncbi:MAG TPA: asparagine synthase-related protein [Candidatus Krumholzibacteria bacterium]|nr:asparagine synthase-related protein [Candidatus Krumholzibacteria bacterium]HPD73220.1 asparagine synthase-related protein [Candidatus Krumholzibacteria bacterium]HRY40182.1 asparagine synthase-related protein [Candidatus Krumholzibacteria bacterium]
MTAFAGIVALEPEALAAAAAISASLRSGLSRHPGEAIRTGATDRAVVHSFDLDAWADGPAVRDGDGRYIVVCGDPAYGDAASRQAGVDLFADHLARDPAGALAATTGTFALVVVADGGSLLAADKFGSRPIYWARRGDLLCFATSFRALRDALLDGLTVDGRALRETIVAGQPLGDRTLFAEIRLMRPGQMLRVVRNRCDLSQYHDWSGITASSASRDEAVNTVYERFLHGIRRRSYTPVADAFLSGGLDSRAVVAGLLDAGRRVNTFNSSYPGSADHVLGEEIARHLGTAHRTDLRDPVESLRYTMETFANYARRASVAFPRSDGRPGSAGRLLWSGDGGSVLMGHVYLTDDRVRAFAAAPIGLEAVRDVCRGSGSRIVRGSRSAAFREKAHAEIAAEIDAIACPRPARRLYLYHLLNNQARHLYWHHEQADRSRVELVTPFFDAKLVETIISLPTEWFVRHGFYNDWIGRFGVRADGVPWQVYPGHLPGPHPPRPELRQQWRGDWQGRREMSRIYRRVAGKILKDGGRFSRAVLDYRWLAVYYATFALCSDRFGYEIPVANKLSAELDRRY